MVNAYPRITWLVLGVVGVVVCVSAVVATRHPAPSFDDGSYQAVFLSNNQVYFGHIQGLDTSYPVLSNVYYIQTFAAQDLTTKSGGQFQLVKLGSELHQPQDTMYLNRSQILFIEPLKPDSQIVKSIAEFQKQR